MKIKLYFIMILCLFIYSQIYSQTSHLVQLIGNSFQPAQLTVMIGDTVRWENTDGGLHNVVADDNSFSSGSPSSDVWVFEHVFTSLGDYQYYCEVHGAAGGIGMSGTISVQGTTDIEKENSKVLSYSLGQNYPNPFNPATSISFSIEKTNFTELVVYNSIGEQVISLVSETLTPGQYTFSWDATALPSGIYFYRLMSGNFIDVKKMTLLK